MDLKVSIPPARLRPITSAQSQRYFRTGKARPETRVIPSLLFSAAKEPGPRYLPPGWNAFIQPEGQLYFYNSQLRVVTEAYLYSSDALRRISIATVTVLSIVRELNIQVPSNSELFLQLDEDDEETCGYYFVDHESRTEFWLTSVSSDDVDIPESTSLAQLRWTLEEHYWNHVEYFPMHISYVKIRAAQDLLSILTHGRADNLTSNVGTFPFNATQCQEFIELIRNRLPSDAAADSPMTDGSLLCSIARIWSQVARHRFIHFYGEEHARLSRDQRLLESEPISTPFYSRALSAALFYIPDSYVAELDKLWVDDLVYVDPWKGFMSICLAEWKEAVQWTMLLLIAHTIFFSSGIGRASVSLASLALTICGLISGIVLSHYHRLPLFPQAADAAAFLAQVHHPKLGFQSLALVYSLPKALLIWSTALIGLQASLEVVSKVDGRVATALLCSLGVVLLVSGAVLRRGAGIPYEESEGEPFWRKLLCLSRRTEVDLEVEGKP